VEILTAEQMRRVDRRAIETLGLPGLELMEAAGRGIAEALLADLPRVRERGVTVLCGRGNNGGDGLVIARHLAAHGVPVEVLLLASPDQLTGDAAVNLGRARGAGIDVQEIADERAWAARAASFGPGSIVVDALLGTGVRGGARGLIATAIESVNASGAVVIAVDLPSGMDADAPGITGTTMRASRTYTLGRPKTALVLGPAAARAGRLSVIPIGIPDEAVRAEGSSLEWFDHDAAAALHAPRVAESHKGTYGHLLAVAGSRDRSGAAVLVARGALRAGAGLVTVACPGSVQARIAVQQAEIMTSPLPETPAGELSRAAASAALALAAERDALAVGPGLGASQETAAAVRALVRRVALPLVLDADALNAFALERRAPPELGSAAPMAVLTPHPGEAARLLDCTASEIQSDRLAAARRLAAGSGAIVVLKGYRTIVAAPDARASINASGNPGLATGGTGDVLTGVIGALLARGSQAWDAARLGVWLHGDAADRVAALTGDEGLIASDVAARLPTALHGLARDLEEGGPRP
jgi:NAD(P)H-hydrate epimerase